jgi:hypothetical protein
VRCARQSGELLGKGSVEEARGAADEGMKPPPESLYKQDEHVGGALESDEERGKDANEEADAAGDALRDGAAGASMQKLPCCCVSEGHARPGQMQRFSSVTISEVRGEWWCCGSAGPCFYVIVLYAAVRIATI